MRNTGEGRQRHRERDTANKEREYSLHDGILLPVNKRDCCVPEHTLQYSSAVTLCHEYGRWLQNITLYIYYHVLNCCPFVQVTPRSDSA